GGDVLPVVDHQRGLVLLVKLVAVHEAREWAGHLLVDERARRIHGGDARAQAQREAEVARLPLHPLAELDAAARASTDGALAGVRHRAGVKVDVTGEVEDTPDGCLDEGLEPDPSHAGVLGNQKAWGNGGRARSFRSSVRPWG